MGEYAKGKYEVIRILRDSVLAGLAAYGVSGMQCLESALPAFNSADNVVLLKMSGLQTVGWQRGGYEVESDGGAGENGVKRTESWIEEQKWDVTVVMKRDGKKVNADTLTAEDVASRLVSWFNGAGGIASLRKHDCAPLFTNMSDVRQYIDDSGVYQNSATFTLRVQVPKKFRFDQDMATPVLKGIEGV